MSFKAHSILNNQRQTVLSKRNLELREQSRKIKIFREFCKEQLLGHHLIDYSVSVGDMCVVVIQMDSYKYLI